MVSISLGKDPQPVARVPIVFENVCNELSKRDGTCAGRTRDEMDTQNNVETSNHVHMSIIYK